MTASLKAKLIAGFILAFLAGGAAGTFFAFHQARDWRRHFRHHPYSLAEGMRDRLRSQLDLTPEQMTKIGPILDEASKKLQKIRAETGTQVRQIMRETNQSLQPILTEEQRIRLQRLDPRAHLRAGPRHLPRRRPPPPPENGEERSDR